MNAIDDLRLIGYSISCAVGLIVATAHIASCYGPVPTFEVFKRSSAEDAMSAEKTSRRPRVYCHSGFTLIEVLVVVAIIALLVAILLPSLSKARQQARNTVCAANLKSIGHAVLFYTQAQKDFYPGAGSWPELVGPYLQKPGSGKVQDIDEIPTGTDDRLIPIEPYMCSGDEQKVTSGAVYRKVNGEYVRFVYPLSFGMNVYVSYPLADVQTAQRGDSFGAYAVNTQIGVGSDGRTRVFYKLNKTTDIKRPSDIVLITDAGQDDLYATNWTSLRWDYDKDTDPPSDPRDPGMLEVHHKNGNNFLFTDHHVEFKKIIKSLPMEGVPAFPQHWIPIDGIKGMPPQ